MCKGWAYIIIIFVILSTLSGCGKVSNKEKEEVLAVVGASKVTVSDFNERISKLPERYRKAIEKRKREYLGELINDMLLYQEASRRNIIKDKDVQKVIEEAKKKIVIAKLLKDETENSINITEDEIKTFYESNKIRYMMPEFMRVSHILVPTEEEAKAILKEYNKGAVFEELARAKSVDPTAQRGGDIGYFPKGQLIPEFENATSRLDIGEVSGVVKTSLGYHIIKLTDRKKPMLRSIEDVADDIRMRLHAMKRQKIFNELLEKLRKETVVKVDEKVLSAITTVEEVEVRSEK